MLLLLRCCTRYVRVARFFFFFSFQIDTRSMICAVESARTRASSRSLFAQNMYHICTCNVSYASITKVYVCRMSIRYVMWFVLFDCKKVFGLCAYEILWKVLSTITGPTLPTYCGNVVAMAVYSEKGAFAHYLVTMLWLCRVGWNFHTTYASTTAYFFYTKKKCMYYVFAAALFALQSQSLVVSSLFL